MKPRVFPGSSDCVPSNRAFVPDMSSFSFRIPVMKSVDSPDPSVEEQIQENVASVRKRIQSACERADRDPSDVRLCAVTKTRPVESQHALASAGVHIIGENRVQEAEQKFRDIPDSVELHLVGHLQSNKTSLAVQLFDAVHSVDRPKIVDYLDRHCDRRNIHMPVFLQVNIAGEQSKHGVPPEKLDDLYEKTREADPLEVKGLMTMAPYMENPEDTRPVFRKLRELKQSLQETYRDDPALTELSMGMTRDYHIAVEEGATMVRIGRALFQDTPYD